MTLGEFMAKAEVMLARGATTRTAELWVMGKDTAYNDIEIDEYHTGRTTFYITIK